MPMIKIDKGVPYQENYLRRLEYTNKYPFKEMEIGDSFFAEVTRKAISGSASQAKKRTGFCFSARAVTENGVVGVRVWRVS